MHVVIAGHKECPSSMGGNYRCYRFWGEADGEPFVVYCEDGQYDYDRYPATAGDDDEPIQMAIGEYMEANDIDPGIVHR